MFNRGFTLVETLVAITVMLLVITGPMTVAQKGIQNAYFATQQATAVFLAQEGLESVREFRDDVALSVFHHNSGRTDDWFPESESECVGDSEYGGCIFTGDGYERCTQESCGELYFNNGEFSHDIQTGATKSPFSRRIYISFSANGAAQVESVVTWKTTVFGGFTPREVRLQSWIYDHYERYEP